VTLSQDFLESLVKKFRTSTTKAFALKGSYARSNANEFSDIDVMHLSEDETDKQKDGSYVLENKLVTLSTALPSDVEKWFGEPGLATQVIAGLRQAKALYDPQNVFAELQTRANTFVWTPELQGKANGEASKHMAGLVEEVQKGLGGLTTHHAGKLLQARFGLSWLLAGIMQVQRGVLIESDNTVVEQITRAVGLESSWSRWCYRAFGLENPGLREEVTAGLMLYTETYQLVREVLRPQDKALVTHAIKLIEQARVRPL
jgi:predicted nucleotidyltransferase